MKKIIIAAICLLVAVFSYSQSTSPYLPIGSPAGNNMIALSMQKGFGVPQVSDTTNIIGQLGLLRDSVGMIVFDFVRNVFWGRIQSTGSINKWVQMSTGGGGNQGWQDVLIVDPDLTQNNTVNGNGHEFTFNNNEEINISAGDSTFVGVASQLYLEDNGTGYIYSQTDANNWSAVNVSPGGVDLNSFSSSASGILSASAGGAVSGIATDNINTARFQFNGDGTALIQGNLDSSVDAAPNVVGIDIDGNWHRYSAFNQRFGIEDNLGIQNRRNNFEGYNLEMDSVGSFAVYSGDLDFNGAATAIQQNAFSSQIYAQSNGNRQASFLVSSITNQAEMASTDINNTRSFILLDQDSIEYLVDTIGILTRIKQYYDGVVFTESTNSESDILTQTLVKAADLQGDYTIPLSVSVNGGSANYADAQGNIDITAAGAADTNFIRNQYVYRETKKAKFDSANVNKLRPAGNKANGTGLVFAGTRTGGVDTTGNIYIVGDRVSQFGVIPAIKPYIFFDISYTAGSNTGSGIVTSWFDTSGTRFFSINPSYQINGSGAALGSNVFYPNFNTHPNTTYGDGVIKNSANTDIFNFATPGTVSIASGNLSVGAANNIVGTATNNSATAGNIGEEVNSTVSTYTNYTSTATYQNITSITLTAGDWDISAFFTYSSNSATITAASNAIFVISTTTASAAGATEGQNIDYVPQAALLGTSKFSDGITPYRVSLSGTTTYYLNSQATFTIGNPQYVGSLRARRLR